MILFFQLLVAGFSIPLGKHWDEGIRPSGLTRIVRPPTLWPFINYPMYSGTHHPGDTIPHVVLLAEFADGSQFEVKPEAIGVGESHYEILLRRLLQGDRSVIDHVFRRYTGARGKRPSRFIIKDQPLLMTSKGVRRIEDRVLSLIAVPR